MNKFEVVSRFAGQDDLLPKRATENSCGYELIVAEDTIIPSYYALWWNDFMDLSKKVDESGRYPEYDLREMDYLTKTGDIRIRPTLVSTGIKCYLDPGKQLELSVRSSTPLKYWLIMANGTGRIDGDYVDNPDNEGEIFLQLINLSPYNIKVKRGDRLGQAIITDYYKTDDDAASGSRTGGFGSTGNNIKDLK